jgi:nitrite reductase (NADH) small subunit
MSAVAGLSPAGTAYDHPTPDRGPAVSEGEWTPICPWSRLQRERGVVALVHGHQVAIFRTHDDRLYAIDNRDPKSGAHVLSRGIIGTRGDVSTVASPMHKQVYNLTTGRCLDDPTLYVRTYPVRCHEGVVEVGWRV